jgi:hypothetical protein
MMAMSSTASGLCLSPSAGMQGRALRAAALTEADPAKRPCAEEIQEKNRLGTKIKRLFPVARVLAATEEGLLEHKSKGQKTVENLDPVEKVQERKANWSKLELSRKYPRMTGKL